MITVIPKYEKRIVRENSVYVDTTSQSANDWTKELSPFSLGPCPLYNGYSANIMENAWQYSKVYSGYTDENGDPDESYFNWAKAGWTKNTPVRYPMGKGKRPLFSWWAGKRLGYIEARKKIYAPLYARCVIKTAAYSRLQEFLSTGTDLYLIDYDAYRHGDLNMSLTDVLNFPDKKMGHAFVLMMLLTQDSALKEIDFCSDMNQN
jgi:hypothetical protein